MKNITKIKILQKCLQVKNEVCINVFGTSMEPTLFHGDAVTISKMESYSVGDVLVFEYKDELLIHRLIKVCGDRFFCKGDNSLRLEDVKLEHVLGQAILVNGKALPLFPQPYIKLSYLVNQRFKYERYNINRTQESTIYRFYYQTIWHRKDERIKYKKNQGVRYLCFDDGRKKLFNKNDGNIYTITLLEMDLLDQLDNCCDFDTLNSYCLKKTKEDVLHNLFDLYEFLAKFVVMNVIDIY